MSFRINADDGVVLPLEDLDVTFAYNGNDTLNYLEVVYRNNTYRQTFEYTGGKVTKVTRWEKQ